MTTAIELPDALADQVRQRAERDGLRFNDAVADLLRDALAARTIEAVPTAKLVRDEVTGLYAITGGRSAPPGEELTPERIHEILREQDVERFHAASRR